VQAAAPGLLVIKAGSLSFGYQSRIAQYLINSKRYGVVAIKTYEELMQFFMLKYLSIEHTSSASSTIDFTVLWWLKNANTVSATPYQCWCMQTPSRWEDMPMAARQSTNPWQSCHPT
jgi:hypothetical protein